MTIPCLHVRIYVVRGSSGRGDGVQLDRKEVHSPLLLEFIRLFSLKPKTQQPLAMMIAVLELHCQKLRDM